jgi:DNA adenine methylase
VTFKTQLLKWVGNKQRFAHEIISYFPEKFDTYFEPFIGSGAVIGTLAPKKGVAGDILKPLVQIWQAVIRNPDKVVDWYKSRYEIVIKIGKEDAYEKIRESYNKNPNPGDLLFISRSCYGGVVRFRQKDGFISTPCGVHNPISPESFSNRVRIWHERLKGTTIYHADFEKLFNMAKKGDVIYCDPPYFHTQAILYGAQTFYLGRLFEAIEKAKWKGVFVALSIDGTKKSGNLICNIDIPKGLFKRDVSVNCGRSMLRRFQLKNQTLESEVVSDRLMLTW